MAIGAAAAMLAVAGASAAADPYVYVAVKRSHEVLQFDAPHGLLHPLTPPAVGALAWTSDIVAAPGDRYVFAADTSAGVISTYAVGAGGRLARAGQATGFSQPTGLAVTPDGRFLYSAPGIGAWVDAFAVGADGSLHYLGHHQTPRASNAVAVDPEGRYAYVATRSGAISAFAIREDGRLTALGDAMAAADSVGLAITPDGRHLYAANRGADSVSAFAIEPGGRLSALGTLPAGRMPSSVAVTPDSAHAYVTAEYGGAIHEYDIGPGGRLHPLGTADSYAPSDIAIAPDGRHAYVPSDLGNRTTTYAIGPAGRLHEVDTTWGGDGPKAVTVTGRSTVAAHGRVGRDTDGRLELFVLREGELWDYRQGDPGEAFSATPVHIGGHGLVGRPAVGATRDGRLAVFVVDGEHGHVHVALQHRAGGDFGPLRSLGDPDPHDPAIPSHPAVATNANGRLEVFVTRRGEGLSALRQNRDGSFPDTWHDLGGTTRGAPAAATSRDELVEVVTRDRDGQLLSWFQREPNGHFIGPERRLPGGTFSADPDIVPEDGGRLVVFARHADDGHVYADVQRHASDVFGSWTDLGGPGGHGAPDATLNADGRLEVVARNRDEGISVARQTKPGAHFHPWTDLGGHNFGFLPAALADGSGRIALFVTSEHNHRTYLNRQLEPNGDFEPHFTYVGEGG